MKKPLDWGLLEKHLIAGCKKAIALAVKEVTKDDPATFFAIDSNPYYGEFLPSVDTLSTSRAAMRAEQENRLGSREWMKLEGKDAWLETYDGAYGSSVPMFNADVSEFTHHMIHDCKYPKLDGKAFVKLPHAPLRRWVSISRRKDGGVSRHRLAALTMMLACNASSPRSPTSKHEDACWPVARMRLLTRELGTGAGPLRPITEMTADGAIHNLGEDQKPLSMFARVRDDALFDARGTKILSCVDRELLLSLGTAMARYDSDDVYVVEHSRLWITSDGTLMRQDWDKPAMSQGLIEGVTPRTRRTAMLLVIAGLGGLPR